MPRMYVRPESGSRVNGRYAASRSPKQIGLKKIHDDATSYLNDQNNIVKRGSSNDVRNYNNIGKAFKPLAAPEDHLTPKPYERQVTSSELSNPFPLKSNKKTITEFKDGVIPGSSTQMRVSNRNAHYTLSDPDSVSKGLISAGKASDTSLPPEVAMGDKKAVNDYIKAHKNFISQDTPHMTDIDPYMRTKTKAISAKEQYETISEHDKNLPALIERNDYLPDGSRLEDRLTLSLIHI